MRTRKRIPFRFAAMLAVVLLFGTVSAAAQPRPRMADPEARLERRMSHLTSTLKLTDEQATRVREILSEQIKKQQELFESRREQFQEQREATRSEMEEWRAETDAKMAEVLTEEQLEKYKKDVDENRRAPRMQRRAPQRSGGRRGR